jgi:BREX system ATP-binding protein BrxC/D
MAPQDWLDALGREYLADYIRGGGAAVKFAVSSTDAGRLELRDGLRSAAEHLNYQFALVDASQSPVHQIDRLFHAVARQIDWDELTRAYLERLLRVRGLRLPAAPERLAIGRLAELNAAPEVLLRSDLQRAIHTQLFDDYAMSREFRLAMVQLCAAHLDPTDSPLLESAIKDWLRGELRLVSGVKRALIFRKIARHNARDMLFSLAHWLTLAGKSGLVLALDISRYADTARPAQRGEGRYYSTPATMDLYETLREMIDATDDMQACFIGVLPAPEFLQDDARGVRAYQALLFRIWDEVHDARYENPLACLARIEGAA